MGSQELGLGVREAQWNAAPLLRAALIDLCFDRGFASLTIGDVCRRAGLGPAVFWSHYRSLEDCFLQICAGELRRYGRLVAVAVAGTADWRTRLRAASYALYRAIGEDEALRRLVVVEARAAGERSALLVEEAIESLYDLIDEGRAGPWAAPTVTRATAEFLGGAIFNEVYVASARRAPLPPEREVVPKLMYLTVAPYRGSVEAAEELTIPPPGRWGTQVTGG
jgi:AcrR family transcriptional regulator